jgi:hypothetical protein
MRAVLATALSLYLALAALAPHVHVGPHGAEDCAVCVARGGEVATCRTPDLAPAAVVAGQAVLAPGLAPVTGAPLGAIPGQSPPRA